MEGVTRIIAVRHGETAWNVEARLQGQLDIPLNAHGQAQAQRTARSLAEDRPDVVVSSDLERARATACAIAEFNRCPLVLDEGLRERGFGRFEGMTHHEIAERWPEESRRWRSRDPDFAPGDGESLRVFYERCVEATLRIAQAWAGRTVVLVAHGGVLDCLYRAATRAALDAPRIWQLDNAAINRLLHTDSGLMMVGWNDTLHLDDRPLDEL
ncbi:MAG TPA: histidine phosphatase family protein [Burkholderiaceae bacterium]|nr:histidine phosphatase family protein [Burkholderiaceae bacterium]